MKLYHIYLILIIFLSGCLQKHHINKSFLDDTRLIKAKDHFTAGMFHELNGDHEKALIDFYLSLLYDSSSAVIYNRIAENHMALGRYESALKYLENSKRINNSYLETFRLLSKCHYKLKNDSMAINYLEEVLKKDPVDNDARNLLILLYRKNGNMLGLAQQYEILMDYYGHDESLLQKATAIYLKSNDLESAKILYLNYLKTDSTNANIWYSLSRIYEIEGNDKSAIKGYLKAIQYAPELDDSFERLHFLYRKNNDWKGIIKNIKPYAIDDTSNVIANYTLAEAYYYKKEYEKSKKILNRIKKDNNFKWQVYDLLGRIELEQKNYQEAEYYFKELIDNDKNNRIGWLFLGFVYTDMDSLHVALDHYKSALKNIPEDPFLLAFYGITLSQLDKNEEALIPLEKSLSIDGENTSALISYGITLNKLDRKQEAILSLKKAIQIDDTNINAISTLASIYDEIKMYKNSDSLYTISLKRFPENDLLMNNYAYSLSERGKNLNFALELAQKAVQAEPQNGAYLDTMGWILYKMGKYEKALNYIKNSVELRPDSAVVLEHLGDVYNKLSDNENSKYYWNKALEFEPDNERLKQKLNLD